MSGLGTAPPADPAVGVSAALVAAVSETWAAIRARHPQVPPVVVTFGSGTPGTTRGQERLGHFAGGRWLPGRAPGAEDAEHGAAAVVIEDAGEALAELFVGGEGLRHGAVELLDTLLHEAAHALAHARGIPDTSRQGRYHNARYRKVAIELGLDVAETKSFGWTDTTVPPATRTAYAAQLDQLRAALLAWRRPEIDARRGTTPGQGTGQAEPGAEPGTGGSAGDDRDANRRKNGVVARCACLAPDARQFRVSEPVLALGPIICGACEEPFTVDPD